MKWIKITAVSAFFLIAVNVFLLYNLARQYAGTSLIEEQTINKTIKILEKADIHISKDIIPLDKPHFEIFEGDFFSNLEEYYINSAVLLSGNKVTDDFTLHMINNGIKIIDNKSGEVLEFFDNDIFAFSYMKDIKYADYLNIFDINDSDMVFDSAKEDQSISSKKIVRKTEQTVNEKFFGNGDLSKVNNMRVKIDRVYYNKEKNAYLTEGKQIFNGLEIYGCKVVCIIYGSELLYAEGNIIFTNTGNSYNTTLYDQLSVLFDEKTYIEQQINEPLADVYAYNKNTDDVFNITEFKCIYCISWNANRTKYYLIPSWYIEYNGNFARIRNAINGNIHTI